MVKVSVLLKIYKNLENARYWINYLEQWNKQNNKNYTRFSNKQTNNNGCMDLVWLIGEKVRLQKELKSKSTRYINYYKNNHKCITNEIFK